MLDGRTYPGKKLVVSSCHCKNYLVVKNCNNLWLVTPSSGWKSVTRSVKEFSSCFKIVRLFQVGFINGAQNGNGHGELGNGDLGNGLNIEVCLRLTTMTTSSFSLKQRNPYWRGRISTISLLVVQISCFLCWKNMCFFLLFNETTYLALMRSIVQCHPLI